MLRRLARNLLRLDRSRKGRVAAKRFRAALDQPYLTTLLAAALGTEDAFALCTAAGGFTMPTC